MDRLRDAAEIYTMASDLFTYGRGEEFRQKSKRESIFQTIRILGYYDGIDDEVWEYFEKRYPS